VKVYRWRDIEKGKLSPAQLSAGDLWAAREVLRLTLRDRSERLGEPDLDAAPSERCRRRPPHGSSGDDSV
jgi:hypothetical protein